jgi:hypothetical protein
MSATGCCLKEMLSLIKANGIVLDMIKITEAIVLEDLIVRYAALNTLAEIIDGRGWQ